MLQCSCLCIVKEIIIFMTSCKLVIGNYKGLYNANIWMSTALWGISGNGMVVQIRERHNKPVNTCAWSCSTRFTALEEWSHV